MLLTPLILSTPVYSYAYDSLGRVVSETDPLGGSIAYAYDAAGRLLTFTDQLNRTTSYTYDNLGLLESETDALGNVTSYGYDLSGNLTGVTDALGNTTSYAYDALSRNTSITDALGAVVSLGYDAAGQLTSQTDQLGNTTSYSYDDVGQLLSVSDPLYNTTSYAYDAVGNLLSTTNALGSTTSYGYDALYRNTSITDALGGVIALDYDAAGQILSQTDQLGRTTSYAYDDLGQVTAMTDPAGGVTGYAYDSLGSLLTLTDALGNQTSYDYDLLGQTTSVTDALGGVTGLAYNAAGELTSETNVLGQTTSYGYDLLGRRTTITDSLGNVTTSVYDPVGNLTGVTDPLAQTTSYAYDELHRLISETDANGGVVAYTYDAASNMLSLTDPGGNTTSWTYDALHRAIQETNELGYSRYFQFDAVGNLTERTDRNGRVRDFDYDALNRRTEERWLEDGATVNTIDFSYDAASQLTAASDAVSAYTYQYNDLGLITQVDNFGTSVGPHTVLDYTFDALGNKTSLIATINGVGDFQNNYTYDALSRMTSVQQTHSGPGGTGVLPVSDKRVDFSYNALGQFIGIDRYADLAATELVVSSSYSYDGASRLTALTHAQEANTLAAYTWTFDDLGRITQATSPDGTSDYSYDATGQLIGADNSFAADETYTYDANGNRTTVATGSLPVEYTTGANNQILSDGTYNYEYDAEGNRTKETNIATGAVTEYEYDHRNRLVRITDRASDGGPVTKQVDYTYDLFGRRLAKHIDNDGDGSVDEEDIYIYDGQRHERGNAGDHILLAFDESGDLTNRYLHGPAVDQILADEQLVDQLVDEVLYPLTDQLGSVRDLAVYNDTTGDTTIANHIIYDSFGQILSESNAAIDHIFAYTGRERDQESGLQYNRARYYHFATASWMSVDPLGFAAGDFNLGRYLANSPTGATDPSGLERFDLANYPFQELRRRGVSEKAIGLFKKGGMKYHRSIHADVWIATSVDERPPSALVVGGNFEAGDDLSKRLGFKGEYTRRNSTLGWENGERLAATEFRDKETGKTWWGLPYMPTTYEKKSDVAKLTGTRIEVAIHYKVPTGRILAGWVMYDSLEELNSDYQLCKTLFAAGGLIRDWAGIAAGLSGGMARPAARPSIVRSPRSIPSAPSRGSLGRHGLAYELKHLNKHLPGTRESARLIEKEGAAHVFKDKTTLGKVLRQQNLWVDSGSGKWPSW